ncbi:unnamed protein product [Cuscuta europaea]|uniref:Uncharacterized protein n=1 Tax=Cuscuta europaea TaxID=41803 RepID=A0A9P1EGW4_CUSEU|nr:unnamed protein product [Cuscuta europaea]
MDSVRATRPVTRPGPVLCGPGTGPVGRSGTGYGPEPMGRGGAGSVQDYCDPAGSGPGPGPGLFLKIRGYSRKTVKKEISRLYGAEKVRLQNYFANFDGRVTVCSDIWEDTYHNLHYLGLTVHYIDNDWHMHKRVLAFREFNDRHTAEHIYILIERILIEYNLIDKVFAIDFDNATNNTAAIPRLRELCGSTSLMGRFFINDVHVMF